MRVDVPSFPSVSIKASGDAVPVAAGRSTAPAGAPSAGSSEAVGGPDAERVDAAITAAHQFLRPIASSLRFVRDDSSGRILIRLVDNETQKVLRQIPSEEMLAINKALDRLQGLMVELKV